MASKRITKVNLRNVENYLQFSTFANPIIHRVYPPKFCIMVVFDFSWDMKMTQEKSKTMAMQIFGALKRCIMGFAKVENSILDDSSRWSERNLDPRSSAHESLAS